MMNTLTRKDDWMKGLGVNFLPTNINDEEPVNDADIALDLDITSIQMKDG